MPDNYVIAGGIEGKERLNVLSDALRPYTKELLLRAGLQLGYTFLDNGCGGGNVANMVAEMVGSKGKVTGVDIDDTIIELAKKDSIQQGITNTRFIAANASELSFEKEFDIAYSRFLLSHLQEPLKTLQRMCAAVKTGGKVVVEDIQFSGHFSYPANAAFHKYLQLYTSVVQQKGADANIGPRLPQLFAEAGLKHISFDVIQPCFQTGKGKWMGYITLDKIQHAVIESGLATTTEMHNLLQELEAFTKDEASIISLPRIFRVIGTVE